MASPGRDPTGKRGSLARYLVFAKRGAVVATLAALELKIAAGGVRRREQWTGRASE
jgi:hypothetical protein